MRRGLAGLRPRVQRRTLWGIGLLLVALLGLGLAIAGLARGFDGGLALVIVVSATVLGWGLAASRITPRQSFLAASGTGVVVVFVRVARLGELLLEAIWAAIWAGWVILDPAPDPLPPSQILSRAISRLASGVGVLFSRTAVWIQGLGRGEPAYDPVASALVWSLLLWGSASWAAWATRRHHRPLLGVMPALALGAVAIYYAGGSWAFFLVPLAATLMLMSVSSHDTRQRRWEALGIGTPEGLGSSLAQSAVPLTLALVVVGAVTPSLSLGEAARFFQRLRSQPETQQDRVARSLGLDPQPLSGSGLHAPRPPGLPNRHLIGSGPELSENLVMTPIIAGLPFEEPTPRLYWRTLTYDRYLGRGWGTSPTVTWEYRAGDPTVSEVPPFHRVVKQRIQAQAALGGLAYMAGSLAAIDQRYEVAWRAAPLDPLGASVESTDYQAESLVPVADPNQLRSSSADYPDWIQDRYLALHEDLPDRVVALARDLTATAATPYDRAVALENYLRGYPYNLDVPAPPPDRDVADWFLFDLKEGYCDYYATAMAVLARAAGLPARLVVGFYTGTPERSEGVIRYLVTEADSHSWVEIYFPGYGWIEFEPTAGRPAIARSEAEDPIPEVLSGPSRLEIPSSAAAARWQQLARDIARAAGAVLLLIGAGSVGWIVSDRWRLGRLSPRRAVEVLYRRLVRAAEGLGIVQDPGTTPYELGRRLAREIRLAEDRPAWAPVLTPVTGDLAELIDLQVRSAFGPAPPPPDAVRQAVRRWSRVSPRLWMARFLVALDKARRTWLDSSSTTMVQEGFIGPNAQKKEVVETEEIRSGHHQK